MNKLIQSLILASLFISGAVYSEVAVIVHPSNSASIGADDISRMFLGRKKSFSDGAKIIPVNQKPRSAPTKEFNSKVLKKKATQLKAYWSKLVFTGKGRPPKELGDDAAVVNFVANEPGAIGYIDASKVDSSVKVVAKF